MTSDRLAQMKKMFTVRIDEKELAEFSVATKILGHRSMSGFVHFFMRQKVREARDIASDETFTQMVTDQLEETEKLSKQKAKEAKRLTSTRKLIEIGNKEAKTRKTG